jgi:hypothetical protein
MLTWFVSFIRDRAAAGNKICTDQCQMLDESFSQSQTKPPRDEDAVFATPDWPC